MVGCCFPLFSLVANNWSERWWLFQCLLGDMLPACSPTAFWGGFLMSEFFSQWLLDGFPASLVCQCTVVLPGAFPSKVLFSLATLQRSASYDGLAFVPSMSSDIMWGP